MMRKCIGWILIVSGLAVITTALAMSAVGSEPVNARGVIANERVVNLPNDSEKWHLSIVGVAGERHYENLLGYFGRNGHQNLINLRKQVHYREIANNTVIYRERYAPNVKGLPTVRLQKSKGEVVYEVHGDDLPLSPSGLYGALANSVSKVQGRGIFMPWRRYQRRGPCPDNRCPRPDSEPPPEADPPPAPIDGGGPPEMSAKSGLNMGSVGIGAGGVLLCLSVGSGLSLFVQWRKKYRME